MALIEILSNQLNYKITMRDYLLLSLIVVLTACGAELPSDKVRFIEPCEYELMGYKVHDVSSHDSVDYVLKSSPMITVVGDSVFNVSGGLVSLFNGAHFIYRVVGDSLILDDGNGRQSYGLIDLDANSFRVEVVDRHFEQLDMVKPNGKRRKVLKTMNVRF